MSTNANPIEKRIITATKSEWSKIAGILFSNKISVPANPLNLKQFINSKFSLRLIDFNTLSSFLSYTAKTLLLKKILNSLGIAFIISSDQSGIELIALENFDSDKFIKSYTTVSNNNSNNNTSNLKKELQVEVIAD